LIRPLKCEFLSRNPTIVQFYDIIDEEGAQKLLEQTHGPGKFRKIESEYARMMEFNFDDDGAGQHDSWGTFNMAALPKHFKILTHVGQDEATSGRSPENVGHSLAMYAVGGEYKLHTDMVSNFFTLIMLLTFNLTSS